MIDLFLCTPESNRCFDNKINSLGLFIKSRIELLFIIIPFKGKIRS